MKMWAVCLWGVCQCYSSAVIHGGSLPHCWLRGFDTNSSSRMGERAVSLEQPLRPPIRRVLTNGTCEADCGDEDDEGPTGTRSHCLHMSGTLLYCSSPSNWSLFALSACSCLSRSALLSSAHCDHSLQLMIIFINGLSVDCCLSWPINFFAYKVSLDVLFLLVNSPEPKDNQSSQKTNIFTLEKVKLLLL